MKKSLGVVASLALVWSAQPAQAELFKNLRIGGQIDIQATAANNVTDFSSRATRTPVAAPGAGSVGSLNNDRIGDLQTRVMLNLDWDLLDDVHARVTLRKNDRTWGTNGGTVSGTEQSQPITQGGGNDLLGNTFIDEANFKVDKVAGQIDLTLGRQFYGSSGDIVIQYGPSEKAWYGMPVVPIDIARLDWSTEDVGITGIAGKVTGHALGVAAAADTDVRGLNIAMKGTEHWSAALYGYNRVIHNIGAMGTPATVALAGGKNDNLYVVGLKLRLAGAGFWWKGEFDQNFGENRAAPTNTTFSESANYTGYAFMSNTGWKYESESSGMFSIWGEYALGSGRQQTRSNKNDGFVAIRSDYRPGSIYGRFAANGMSAVTLGGTVAAGAPTATSGLTSPVASAGATSQAGLNNRQIWGVGVRASPGFANKLVAGASFWDFRLHRVTKTPQTSLPGTLIGTGFLQGNRHIGSEIDVDLVWTHSENVAFAAGWGTFLPGGLIKEANRFANLSANAPTGGIGTNPATMVYFDTRVKF